jgi:hypothetical protein
MAGKIMWTGTAVTSSCCTTLSMWDGANPHTVTSRVEINWLAFSRAYLQLKVTYFYGLTIIQRFQPTVRGLKHRRKIV